MAGPRGTYSYDDHRADNPGNANEDGTAEETHQGDFASNADLHCPEERKWDGHEVEVCQDIGNHHDEDVGH